MIFHMRQRARRKCEGEYGFCSSLTPVCSNVFSTDEGPLYRMASAYVHDESSRVQLLLSTVFFCSSFSALYV